MTPQEVFDTVCAHLAQQGRRSVDHKDDGDGYYFARPRCAYRGLGGLKCAIGCLIPDEEYDPRMEGMNATDMLRYMERGHKVACPNTYELLSEHTWLVLELQCAHDTSGQHGRQALQQELLHIAARHELDGNATHTITRWVI